MRPDWSVRPALHVDAAAIAGVFSPSLRTLGIPELHTVEEDCWFIENVILRECEVFVAEMGGSIASFLALQGDEIRLLHTHPNWSGQGAGSSLICAVKKMRPVSLQLWCFQLNLSARRFYERHGFIAVECTDGHRNEEKLPDMRYVWSA